MNRIRKCRVLFVSEAVTLAQVVRLAVLARAAARDGFEVHFACARHDPLVFRGAPFELWPLRSITPAQAERAVAWGLRPYTRRVLERYVADDLALIQAVKPDVIAADLRWSLAVSGPLSRVPVLSLANAYWSPFALRARFPLPDHPLTRLFGARLAQRHFERVLPAIFRWFAAPLDSLRERHGMPPLGTLPDMLAWGDRTLYADPPELVPVGPLPPSHRFIGPVQWAPDAPGPPAHLGARRPLVYVTLGSSGNLAALPAVLDGLSSLRVDVLLATAGRPAPRLPRNAVAVPFVRGDLAARRAAVVVSNGGSTTGYQALAEGTPVVSVPWNLDQYLASDAIERFGAGLTVRSGAATPAEVARAVARALDDPPLQEGARRAAAAMARHDAAGAFVTAVREVLDARHIGLDVVLRRAAP